MKTISNELNEYTQNKGVLKYWELFKHPQSLHVIVNKRELVDEIYQWINDLTSLQMPLQPYQSYWALVQLENYQIEIYPTDITVMEPQEDCTSLYYVKFWVRGFMHV
jgi:hypothetical protein